MLQRYSEFAGAPIVARGAAGLTDAVGELPAARAP